MKPITLLAGLLFFLASPWPGHAQEVKLLADTVAVQAEGKHEADPDLATLAFYVTAQEKELRRAHQNATTSMQRILELAERAGLPKQDISAGPFTVRPLYDWNDRKQRARGYRVEATVVLRVRDFGRIGTLVDGSVEDGIADFRSLTYSLADEEAAKQRAVAEAMRRAEGRARAALAEKGQKLGALRYVSVDVKEPAGIVRLEAAQGGGGGYELMELRSRASAAATLPPVMPEKISVSASVQCVFQIQ